MKSRYWLAALFVFGGAFSASPQSGELSIDDAVQLGQQFLEDNVDPEILKSLNDMAPGEARDFLAQLQTKLNSEYVVDLAELRKQANAILPVLEAHEETAPYAAWLRTRLDYMDAAEKLRSLMPPPQIEPGKPIPPRAKPTVAMEKKIWVTLIDQHPVPKEAQPYVKDLKPVFAAQGVPSELVWLAEVESGFNPKARSPIGAAGLYQLMPGTAKSLGLSTHWPDDRLNPEKTGPAAARYLKYLHGRFKDWKLALAAYNLGEGRLQELMKRHNAKTYDAVAPWLPTETQMYVPKFEAVLQKREGLTLAQLSVPKTTPAAAAVAQ